MQELNEGLLVEKAKTDQAAFSQLYEMYLPKIFAYVTRRIGDRDEAEDLTSNIFVRVLENMKKFDQKKSSFKTWIYSSTPSPSMSA
jgi:RNA polymerase sigma-70 factor (ECF subfamily)